jgi:hypothetical protein
MLFSKTHLRPLLIRLALAAAAVCAGLLLAECLLRVFVERETRRLAIYDRDLGWRGRPHGRGVYIRRKDEIRVPFTYNNYGFRDEDITPKIHGQTRILMLGDSFLESLEVDYHEIFHERVELLLPGRLDTPVDIVAIASQGYSTAQELLAFRRYKDLVQADLVLLAAYSGNDFDDNLRRQFAYLDQQGELRFPPNRDSWPRGQYLTWKRWLYEHSHLVFLVKNQLESRMGVRLGPQSKGASNENDDYKRAITGKIISATRSEVEATGADFALVILPARDELESGDLRWIWALRETCDAEGIPCLDLSRDLKSEHYFPTDIHLNPAGHAVVAERICDFLSDRFSRQLTADVRETSGGQNPVQPDGR